MQKTLTVILALMPSYFSLFAGSVYAVIIMAVSTIVGIILTGALSEERSLTDKFRLAWVLHLLGMCGVVAFFNL